MRLPLGRMIWVTCTVILLLTFAQFSLNVLWSETSLISSVSKKLCTMTNSQAAKALARVKSEQCRAQIEDGACNSGNYLLDEFPESTCRNHNSSLVHQRVGCFVHSVDKKPLRDALFSHSDVLRCQAECYRPGFAYYAIINGECMCGNRLETAEVEPSSDGKCQGAVVHHTGLKARTRTSSAYVHIESLSGKEAPVKILFLLQFNGRNDRQVKRLLKAIYSPEHLYFIHVDKRQKYMKREMERIGTLLPNVYVLPNGFSTIWGGASLLTMYQEVIRQSLTMPEFSTWDYLINLSESDFPVLSLPELEAQLQRQRGKSFLASHGYNTAQFIKKQGFDHYFVECEERMWRVGKREQFPKNIRVDGGSDWLILHRTFAEYSISSETYPSRLRDLFRTILLPLESFYHTLALNSQFCDQIVAGNLKMTNWNRKQGCRCETIKKIVDWCGCSPLVIKKEDIGRFAVETAINKTYYFARKFESLVDVDAIAAAEAQVFRHRPEVVNREHPSFNSTFVNYYDAEIDGEDKVLGQFAAALLKQVDPQGKMTALQRIDIYRAGSNPNRAVYSIMTDTGGIQLLVRSINRAYIFPEANLNGFTLVEPRFGSKLDHKEEIFRNPTGFVDFSDVTTVAVRWIRQKGVNTTVAGGKTSPKVSYSWFNGAGVVVATQTVEPYDSIHGTQFASLDLTLVPASKRIPGTWKALIHEGNHKLAEIYFPVISDRPIPEEGGARREFDRLIKVHIGVEESCTDSCANTLWSTVYPDPKADIFRGYDALFKVLV